MFWSTVSLNAAWFRSWMRCSWYLLPFPIKVSSRARSISDAATRRKEEGDKEEEEEEEEEEEGEEEGEGEEAALLGASRRASRSMPRATSDVM